MAKGDRAYIMTAEEICGDKLLGMIDAALTRRHADGNGTMFADIRFPSIASAANYVDLNDMAGFCVITSRITGFDEPVTVQFAVDAYQIHADAFHGYDPSSDVPRDKQYSRDFMRKRSRGLL